MAINNKVIFDVIANTNEYSKGLKDVDKQTESVTKAMKASFVAVSSAISGSLVSFANYETALVKVGKTTNLQGKELRDFGQEIVKMTSYIPVSSTKLLEMAASAAQLGVKGKKNILDFTETMAKLTTATNIVGEEGSAEVARFLKVTGDGVQTVARFGAVITSLGNQTAATEAEILSMATRVGQATAQFNIGGTNALGISAALRDLGFEAELAGTAMGRTFKTLQSAVYEGGDALETLINITGKTRKELKETFEKDATAAFTLFIDSLSKLPADQVVSALNSMGLSGERVSAVLATLSSRNDVLARSLQIAREEAEKQTALDQEFKSAIDTLANSFNFFINQVKNLASSIGEDLAPDVRVLLEDLTSLVKTLRTLNEETNGAVTSTIKLAAEVTLLYLAFNKLQKIIALTGLTSTSFSRGLFLLSGGAINGAGAITTLTASFTRLNVILKATKVSLGGLVAGIWVAVEAGKALGNLIGKLGEIETSEEKLASSTKKLNDLQEKRLALLEKLKNGDTGAQEKLDSLDKEIAKQQALTNEYQRQVDYRKELKNQDDSKVQTQEPVDNAQYDTKIANAQKVEKDITTIQDKEIENRLASAQREADLIKQIKSGASDQQIQIITDRNAQIANIEAKKLELEGVNEELSKQSLSENERQKLEIKQQAFEQELANMQENFAIKEEERIKQEELVKERELEARELLKEQRLAETEEDLEFLQTKLLTEQEVKNQAHQEELSKLSETHNQFLADQNKFGTAYAKLNKFFNDDRVKGAMQTTSQLVELENSKNKELAAIGKAAAAFQITIQTAQGAISAYSSLAAIPIVGPVLGAAAAAAVVAYGAERMGEVTGASFAVGTDYVPNDMVANIHEGEGIIPAKENQFLQSGELALVSSDFLNNSDNNRTNSESFVVNVNFEGANFNGNFDEDVAIRLADEISSAINESRIAPFPTGVEV